MQTLQLPPGMSAVEAEIFFDGQDLRIIHDGQIFTWATMPEAVKNWLYIQLKQDRPARRLLSKAKISDPNQRLYTYAYCRFGGYNLSPDLTSCGQNTGAERWDCDCKNACPLQSIFRGTIVAPNGKLSNRDITIIKLLAIGTPGKSIAEEICISEDAVNKAKQQIFKKIGVATSLEVVTWAATQNLL